MNGRMVYEQHAGNPKPTMRPARGGPLDKGYPEQKTEGAVAANAANGGGQ